MKIVESLPRGIIPYLPTALTQSGELDRDAMRRLVDRLLRAGVAGLSPLGSTGELPALADDVADSVVASVVEAVGGAVPVIPGVLSGSTGHAADRSSAVTALGASAIVAMIRPWGRVSQAAMIEYFSAMAGATDLPVVLYRQPALGVQPDLGSVVRLGDVENIIAVKDASSDTGFLLSLQCEGSSLEIYSASSHVPMLVWEMGGIGWMGGPCCLAPQTSVAMWQFRLAGDRDSAWRLQRGLWPLCRAFAAFGPAPMVKGGLAQIGFDVGAPVAPQATLSREGHAAVGCSIDAVRRARADLGMDMSVL
ncbi:dihydrodipicolinate synthase family protein [Schaalia naturae]|uniref:Dihydrodipicolinate synthase family protein n=1 Tax=Schaalia naturae TaxID=635203 RepID=A0ABW2SMZ2_9ACTO